MNHHSAPLCRARFRFLAVTSASLLLLGQAFDVAFSAPALNWSASVDTGTLVSDRAKAVGMTNSGDVIAACQIASGTSAQIRVRRLAGGSGSAAWTRDVGTTGVADDVAAIAVDPVTGNTFVAARAASVSNGLDWLVFKVNGSDGSLGWISSYTFSTSGNDQPRAITFTSDNNIAVAGMETNPASGNGRLRVTKINATSGAQIWNYTNPTDGTDAFAVGADTSGNVIAAGCNGGDAFVISLGSTGSSNWSQAYNGAGNGYDAWNALTVFSNGNLAVAGYVTGSTGGQNFCAARYASAGGSPAWVREINGSANGDDAAFDIARDASDDLYAVGLLRDGVNGQTGHLAKIAGASGTVTWSFSKNGGSAVTEATDAFFSVRVLGGDVLAAGTQADAANKSNILVTRYSTAGVFREDTVVDGAAHNHDLLLSKNLLATNGSSLYIIGGDSENASVFSDGVVYAYSTLTPIENWRQTWYGTTSNTGNAADTAVPYGNGIPNLAVFAFFGPSQNPATAKISLLPQTLLSGGNLTSSFTQPAGVSGITYGAESSATLLSGDWLVVPDTGIPPQHNFSIPMGSATKLFLRLKVTNP